MAPREEMPAVLSQLRTIAIVCAVVGGAGLAFAAVTDPERFYRSYLFGYMFVLSLPLGCLGLLSLHHLTGGSWGFVIQRLLEAGVQTTWVAAALFVPVVLGAGDLYHWMDAEAVAHDVVLSHKAGYLNFQFWVTRAVIYFAVWILISWLLVRLSKRQDETGDGRLSNRLVAISGPGMVAYFLTMTFASFDWAMSLEPHWFSTIYGLIFVEGQALTAMAFCLVLLMFARRSPALGKAATIENLHDLGKIQFALIALWAYLNFSQFLIIWYANLPEEAIWYAHRTQGGYEYLATFLVFGQFLLPFLLLITRQTKRRFQALAGIAFYIFLVRLVDLYWQLMPTEHHLALELRLSDFAAPLGLFGIWSIFFFAYLGRRTLMVENDPRWKERQARAHAH